MLLQLSTDIAVAVAASGGAGSAGSAAAAGIIALDLG